eukprot:2300244-Prorocentrum_lima.AAC.1
MEARHVPAPLKSIAPVLAAGDRDPPPRSGVHAPRPRLLADSVEVQGVGDRTPREFARLQELADQGHIGAGFTHPRVTGHLLVGVEGAVVEWR